MINTIIDTAFVLSIIKRSSGSIPCTRCKNIGNPSECKESLKCEGLYSYYKVLSREINKIYNKNK